MGKSMHDRRESVRVKHFDRRVGGICGSKECEPMLARLVGRIGIDHQRERPSLAAVELGYLVAREHSQPVNTSIGEHSACQAVDLGATECLA